MVFWQGELQERLGKVFFPSFIVAALDETPKVVHEKIKSMIYMIG